MPQIIRCARSSSQSVSVVPIIQFGPHGMMNSTLFSVRLMIPSRGWIRSRGSTMCTPLDARTLNWPAAADHVLDLVGPHAGGVDRLPGWTRSPRRSRGRGPRADDPVALPQEAVTRALVAHSAPYSAAVRASIIVCRASSTCAVVVLDRADQGVLAQRRGTPAAPALGSGAGGRQPPWRPPIVS